MKDAIFAENLRAIRKREGLTQEQLESESGLAITLLSQYERGRRLPGLKNIKILCKGLNCTATELLGV